MTMIDDEYCNEEYLQQIGIIHRYSAEEILDEKYTLGEVLSALNITVKSLDGAWRKKLDIYNDVHSIYHRLDIIQKLLLEKFKIK
jgi:hypothetical protein